MFQVHIFNGVGVVIFAFSITAVIVVVDVVASKIFALIGSLVLVFTVFEILDHGQWSIDLQFYLFDFLLN